MQILEEIKTVINLLPSEKELYAAYKEMAADEVREFEALEWAEATFGDVNDEAN